MCLSLPIEDVLPELRSALASRAAAILVAPPGAGKTTRVPLALLSEAWLEHQRIVLLEPRRLAARAAASFMAKSLNESVGECVGYRIRGETRVSKRTRIEVVTEGVLTRMLSSDPTLDGYGAVLFDEFHERSLQADLGLALTIETQRQVRPDLRILVMSATLDVDAVTVLLATAQGPAPVVKSEGRMFPVATHYRPPRRGETLEANTSRVIREALSENQGDVLVFLPGAAEQKRVATRLGDLNHEQVVLHVLHGSTTLAEQDKALAATPHGLRKVVLSTAIAETSLTVEGVRVVVDCGLSRVPRFDRNAGLTRLGTVRVSRASAEQRRGRAGRVAPGVCYRLWDSHEDHALLPNTRAEIIDADLTSLALELADAGASATDLKWIDPPNQSALSQAYLLLEQLGAIDKQLRITEHGKQMVALPLSPRLAHMLLVAVKNGQRSTGAALAAMLEERDILRSTAGQTPSDLRLRAMLLQREATRDFSFELAGASVDGHALERVGQVMRDLMKRNFSDSGSGNQTSQGTHVVDAGVGGSLHSGTIDEDDIGVLLAHAFPDRVAQRRPGDAPRFLLRNGSGAVLEKHDALQREEWLAIAELEGHPPDYRIKRAAPISLNELRAAFAEQVSHESDVWWDEQQLAVKATRRTMLGALVLEDKLWRDAPADTIRSVLVSYLARVGVDALPLTDAALQLRNRLAFLHCHDSTWPDVSSSTLNSSMDEWLGAFFDGVRNWEGVKNIPWHEALLNLLTWQQRSVLDQLAPTHISVPSGSRIALNYENPEYPVLAVKLQECFGWTETPTVLDGRVSIMLSLLSPAQRPVQITRDLAGFWKNSYFEVRRELRGRYPRHPWPDDPLTAVPTRRAKPR